MHIDIDNYALIDSIFHKWDIRLKIISLMTLIFIIASINNITLIIIALLVSFLMIFMSKLPVKFIIYRIIYPIIFLIPLFIFLLFTAGGDQFYKIGYIEVYSEGLILSFIIACKTVALIILFTLMMSTAPFRKTNYALHALKIPHKFISLILFTYRYLFIYFDDLRKMRIALKLRAYKYINTWNSFKINARLVGTIIIKSYEQTEQVYHAMIIRGFSENINVREQFHASFIDKIISFLIISFAMALVILDKVILK